MKFVFYFFMVFAFIGCSKKVYRPYIDDYTNGPIVDYSKKSYENKLLLDQINKKYNDQTLIFFDDQIISVNKFKELINTNQLKILKILKNREDIEKFGYSNTKIQTIILTTKQ